MRKIANYPQSIVDRMSYSSDELDARPSFNSIGPALLFILPHIPLMIAMREVSAVATTHAVLVLLIGLHFAFSGLALHRLAYIAAYIAGSEVIWRMTGARIPWEFGKYAVVILFGLAMVQSNRLRGPLLPLLYMLCIVPGVIVSVFELGLIESRIFISGNISGPLSLFISCWFFSNLAMSYTQRRTLLLVMIAPVVGLSSVVIFGIVNTPDIHFGASSNPVLSGGFGPNQVSAVFGFGAMLAFWYMLDEQASKPMRIVMLMLMLLFLTQSMLTFSRGGFYNLLGSILPAIVFLMADSRFRLRIVIILIIATVTVLFFILPELNEFTEGALEDRFTSTRLSDRDQILQEDIEIWRDNPILGVGPGIAGWERSERSFVPTGYIHPHTEQTRLLSEHGVFGLLAFLLLVTMSAVRVVQAPTIIEKVFIISLLCFCFIYMLHAAMRLLVPGFLFGLTFLTFYQDQSTG